MEEEKKTSREEHHRDNTSLTDGGNTGKQAAKGEGLCCGASRMQEATPHPFFTTDKFIYRLSEL